MTPLRPPSGLRVLLYSHDSYGLGHLRRSITIAGGLVGRLAGAGVLIATGSPCASHFELPPGVDVVKLPSASKDDRGRYVSRTLCASVETLSLLRGRLLLELYRSFRPHLILVDHQPIGLRGELVPVLREARADGVRCVLGIRDIIDEPEAVAREWGQPMVRWALADVYDRICVYGSPRVFDPRTEYPIPPELGERLEFTGYVVRRPSKSAFRAVAGVGPQVLVTAGGGQDGGRLVESYLEAISEERPEWTSTIVLGPLLANAHARELKRRGRLLDGVEVHVFHHDIPRLLASASAVVTMAGYNTSTEVLRSRVPAVYMPRVFPRREQLLRAQRFERLGLGQCLVQPDAKTLRSAIRTALETGRVSAGHPPLNGVEQICDVAVGLLERGAAPKSMEVSS